MKPPIIAIIGAGPVGGILAAHLVDAGHAVALIDAWSEHVNCIENKGLHISGREEILVRPKHLFTSISALRDYEPEYVFICTKACDLDIVLPELGTALKESGPVIISAQNGLDVEEIPVQHFGRGRVLRAVISYAGILEGPGKIRETFFNPPNYLGWLDKSGVQSCLKAAAILTTSGLTTEATEEIKKLAWSKTIFNSCTMSVAALTGMNIQEEMNFPPTRRLVELLVGESIATAAACGFEYGPGFYEKVLDYNIRAGAHRPSMLVDLENGRKTENRFLIRRIADYAEQKGVPAPIHRTMANLIDALEMRGLSGKPVRNAGKLLIE